MTARDRQEGGVHYRFYEIQPWDVMGEWFTHEEFTGFLRGNILKYLARYKDKAGLEDLKKARHYLDKLIEKEEQWAVACPVRRGSEANASGPSSAESTASPEPVVGSSFKVDLSHRMSSVSQESTGK